MKKKIVILGSTGSIGKSTLSIIRKDKKNFDVRLLSTNTNIYQLIKQATEFKVKNLIITDHSKFIFAKKKYKKKKFIFHNSFSIVGKLFKKKEIYYSMISVVGIDGLQPSLELIKYSKNIGIVNKEALICGWTLINKNLNKFKTNFIPIDSEHFSIHSLIKNKDIKNIKKIYITASGGPFLGFTKRQLTKVTLKQTLNHPSWNMGKKISVDSATLMNKVFEVIEAKNIFGITYDKILILTHPKSYLHALIEFNNGLNKLLIHEPDMRIPIHNSIYLSNQKTIKTQPLNLDILNSLNLGKINHSKFPLIKILKILPKHNSLYETALITINDYFVKKYLNKKISYKNLVQLIYMNATSKDFTKFRKNSVKNIKEIYKLRDYVSLKLDTLGI